MGVGTVISTRTSSRNSSTNSFHFSILISPSWTTRADRRRFPFTNSSQTWPLFAICFMSPLMRTRPMEAVDQKRMRKKKGKNEREKKNKEDENKDTRNGSDDKRIGEYTDSGETSCRHRRD